MSLNEKDALDLAVQIVDDGNCNDSSLEVIHLERGYNFQKIVPNIFHLSIERHPNIFGRPSKGMASSAFVTIHKTYELNTDTKTLVKIKEEFGDVEIDYDALADEDFQPDFIDSLGQDFLSDLRKIGSEQEAKDFANNFFDNGSCDWEVGYEPIYEIDLPKDFFENLKNAQKPIVVDAIIDHWNWLKEEEF